MLHKTNKSLDDNASPTAALRRTITGLCAPAVIALLASHAPLANAEGHSTKAPPFGYTVPGDRTAPRSTQAPSFEAPRFVPPRTFGPFMRPIHDDRHNDDYRRAPRFFDNDYFPHTPKEEEPFCGPETPTFLASPDMAQTTANTPVTIAVLANDSFPANQTPSVTVRTSANGADIQVNEDGTVTYSPAPGFTGTDTFEYTIQRFATFAGYSKKKHDAVNPSTTTVTVKVNETAPPPVNTAIIAVEGEEVGDGDNLNVADNDAAAGEEVRFDGSRSVLATGKPPARFQWFVNDSVQQDGGNPLFAFKLPDGTSQVRLLASDGDNSATSEVNVTVAAPPRVIVAKIAVNQDVIDNGGSIDFPDTDATEGETATFDGSQSTLSSGAKPTSFLWFVNGELQQDNGSATFRFDLADGSSRIRLTISDGEVSATSEINVTVEEAPPQANTAIIAVNGEVINDGGNVRVDDTDTATGESVRFDGSQTLIFGEVKPTRFQWFINDSDTPAQDSESPFFETRLADGTSQVRLQASTNDGESFVSATSEVSVTVAAPPSEDVAIIAVNGTVVTDGGSFTVPDTDALPGEGVSFDGSQTLIFGELKPTRFQWFVGNSEKPQQDGSNPKFSPRLADGLSPVRLVAIFEGEGTVSAASLVNVTVTAAAVTPPAPSKVMIVVNGNQVANGGTFSLTDSDAKPGEEASFDASQSTLTGGVRPTSFQWFVGDTLQQEGELATFKFRLSDGGSQVRLVASAGESSAESVVNATVGGVAVLADIPNLTPNQRSVARALDNICSQLVQRVQTNQALTADQQDLLERCQGILLASAADQTRALDELSAQDFNGARLQTLLFTNALYAGVMDRLMALRGGARGLSLAGLNIVIDGKSVPLAELQRMFGQMLGGGAAADDEPGSLFGDKWGAWSRGNFTFGSKDASNADNGFDAKQFSLTAGMDYRLSDKMVLGGAVAFGSSNLDYSPNNEGGLDTKSWAVSIYGSRYAAKNFYLDALVNAASSSFEAHRRISYTDALGTVQRDARGDTDGLTLSSGLSGGYDWLYKGLTLSPNAGVFYVDSTIDKFREGGSRGLNLVYDEQNFKSLTTTLGVRVNYAWNLPFGVLVPYFRGDYVRELKNDVEAFNVRFASDPGNPATPIIVQSDDPDQSYFRFVAGLSGQFPFGVSGYVEYQRLQGFEFVSFNDLSMGLRVQYRY